MKSFFVRLLSGIVLLAVIISTGIIGGPLLFLLNAAVAFIGYWEFLRVFGLEKRLPGLMGYAFALGYYVLVYLSEGFALFSIGIVSILFLTVLMGVYVFAFPRFNSEEITAAFFGFFYVPVMLSFLYLTRTVTVEGSDSCLPYFLIFICSWGCDTCAYAVGMLIGKHKMAPVLSPKKSIEGGLGGVLGAALIGFIYASVFSIQAVPCAILCGFGAVVSQIGDLAASAVKRNHDIKDYGNLIPGHGGILDRFDSVILTAPLIYLLSMVFWM